MKKLNVSVFYNGRKEGCVSVPLTLDLIDEYVDGMAVYNLKRLEKRTRAFVEAKIPRLRGKDFNCKI